MLDAIAAVMLTPAYDAEIREEAAAKLAYAERPESLPAFRRALKDPDAKIRRHACLGIWRLWPPKDDELEEMLVDPHLVLTVGQTILDALIDRGRFPRNADEAVRYLILAGARHDLIALWPRTKRLLFADLRSDSSDRQLYATRCLIHIGYGDETLAELVSTLDSSKDERMAHDFINSGNELLRRAGLAWLQETEVSLDAQHRAKPTWES